MLYGQWLAKHFLILHSSARTCFLDLTRTSLVVRSSVGRLGRSWGQTAASQNYSHRFACVVATNAYRLLKCCYGGSEPFGLSKRMDLTVNARRVPPVNQSHSIVRIVAAHGAQLMSYVIAIVANSNYINMTTVALRCTVSHNPTESSHPHAMRDTYND